ncbi:aldehyde dehydrogenase [Corynebacterium sp.]|uniref:aldehyde dehydrogenase n=1 Tax=Corynebacterium sp. TaxID=1720 RepID=UPI0026DD2290|nr:aldehyde dehydrogenase [Corynebacterium sp.]MDO5076188.1 aldehyde dehydrogenase [Corynebacterium sp.]
MATLTIGQGIQSALSHFALYGLALLCDEQWPGEVRIRWTEERESKAELSIPNVSEAEVADLLLAYARKLSEPNAWPQIRKFYGSEKSRAERAPFSPRFKPIDHVANTDDWRDHQAFRLRALDACIQTADFVSLQWIVGLGEAAYWRCDLKNKRPDEGASRWEMKTRNKGEEFVKDRLGPMVKELSTWSNAKVLEGITGRSIDDSLGKQKLDSRTSTGLTSPAPTDVALAFAGLLGIALFPLAHNTSGLSITPCAWRTSDLHPRKIVLPIPTEPLSLGRIRNILTSEAMATMVEHYGSEGLNTDTSETFDVTVDASTTWLRARGITACSVFPILKAGSDSAPERQIQRGQVKLL